MTRYFRRFACAVAALAGLASCAATPRLFVNPQADMTLYRRVAVVPFVNLSGDPFAGGRVTRAFTTELIIADRFQLVDPAQLLGELDRSGGLPDAEGNIDPAKLRDAANHVEATALIRGSVNEYGLRRIGTNDVPVVSFDVEMEDAATGNVVWRVSVTETGRGRMPILGGPGERTFSRVTEQACESAMRLLRRKAF